MERERIVMIESVLERERKSSSKRARQSKSESDKLVAKEKVPVIQDKGRRNTTSEEILGFINVTENEREQLLNNQCCVILVSMSFKSKTILTLINSHLKWLPKSLLQKYFSNWIIKWHQKQK